jgi:hypothetical protein
MVTGRTFRVGVPARSSTEPSRRQGGLRREPLAELDQLASRALAERKTVAAPRLVGEARLGSLAVQTIDVIVREPQALVSACKHWWFLPSNIGVR